MLFTICKKSIGSSASLHFEASFHLCRSSRSSYCRPTPDLRQIKKPEHYHILWPYSSRTPHPKTLIRRLSLCAYFAQQRRRQVTPITSLCSDANALASSVTCKSLLLCYAVSSSALYLRKSSRPAITKLCFRLRRVNDEHVYF